jgi:exosortase/archaeosortase family protein
VNREGESKIKSPGANDRSPSGRTAKARLPRRPVIRFILAFAGFIAAFDAISWLPASGHFLNGYVVANAWLAGAVLNGLGQKSHVVGDSICSARFTVTVLEGCTATGLISLFWAGLLALPASWPRKTAGMAAGTAVIALLNVMRIVTVFGVGVHYPKSFSTLHEEIWPGLLVLATLALGLGAMGWAIPEAGGRAWAGRLIPVFLQRFTLVFGLLLVPWPGLTDWCGQALRSAGALVFTTPKGAREITFEPQGAHGTRIVIANRKLLNGDGSGLVRNLDFNTRSVLWRPCGLLLALVMVTPMSTRRRLRALGLGEILLILYVLLAFYFTIWNESTEVSLTTLSPFWKSVANAAETSLMEKLSLAIPVLIWLVTAVRSADFPANAEQAVSYPALRSRHPCCRPSAKSGDDAG